jgi:hypothetical protein
LQGSAGELQWPTVWPFTPHSQAKLLPVAIVHPMVRNLPSLHDPAQVQAMTEPVQSRVQMKEPLEPELFALLTWVVVVLPPVPAGGLSTTTFPPQPQARRSAPLKVLTSRVLPTARHGSMRWSSTAVEIDSGELPR